MTEPTPTSDTDPESALDGWDQRPVCPRCQTPLGEQPVRQCPNCSEPLADDVWETFQPVRGKLFRVVAILIIAVVLIASLAIIALSITSPL